MYRKYRPITFDDMIGQDVVKTVLENASKLDDPPHVYLFAGMRGTGKTTAARIFAKALNCTSEGKKPCLNCESCKKFLEGSLDYVEIDAATHSSVDDARSLREMALIAPMSSKYRIFVIDEVHRLSPSAFDALLKIIEEPPPFSIFIFATTEPHKVPKTILSRVLRLDFSPINPELLASYLDKIANLEGYKLEKNLLLAIARRSEGSVRDSLSFLQQIFMLFEKKNLSTRDIYLVLGIPDDEIISNMMQFIYKGDLDNLVNLMDSLRTSSFSPLAIVDSWIYFVLSKINTDTRPLKFIDRLIEAKGDLRYDPNPFMRFELEVYAIFSLLNSNMRVSDESDNRILEKTEDIKEVINKDIKLLTPESSIEQKRVDLSIEQINKAYLKVLEQIKSTNPLLHAKYVAAKPIKFENNKVTFGFSKKESRWHKEQFDSNKEEREMIKIMLSKELGVDVDVASEFIEKETKKDSKAKSSTLTFPDILQHFNAKEIKND
ncbi:DNA polymerase III subunit gamma/tau [Thermodesulfobium narugense]|uniref:DNA polymerase III subunit gamma/tau n=1 Tax=Thermodesulfobium narugense TaxID=184064 RepID=UPI00068DE3D7|nr:DNA polymerase III subunit gamma/tau [Thermodesulfobium narugense]